MGAERTGIDGVIMVMVTTANKEEAAKIANQVVTGRLAACASIMPTVDSTYWWEGKVMNDQEAVMFIKTTSDKFSSLQEAIQKMHSYEVPEIIALPVSNGFLPYLEWVKQETS